MAHIASVLPASALPASALPASALPASALPASALPASRVSASAPRADGPGADARGDESGTSTATGGREWKEWGRGRTALVAGATGLVGRAIMLDLLADDAVHAVHALTRRTLGMAHPKLVEHITGYAGALVLPPVDETYLALGTTIRDAGSQAAFRAVDLDANLAVARAAHAAGCRRIGLVSSIRANARSKTFYIRVKGELEEALGRLDLDALVIARPSLLVGDRAALGQSRRAGETYGILIGRMLGPLIPARYRPVAGADVAHALTTHVPAARGHLILESEMMQPAQ